MEMSFAALIFQGIPEMIAVAALGFSIANVGLTWKRIVISGCLLGVVAFLVRLLPITFGVHTIVLIFMLIFCVNYFGKSNMLTAIMSGLLSFLTLVIVETLVNITIINVFKIEPNSMINNEFLMIISGIPQVILILSTSYLVMMFRKRKTE